MTSALSCLDDCCAPGDVTPAPVQPSRPTLVASAATATERVRAADVETGDGVPTDLGVLLRRTVEGDRAAFTELYAATSRRAFGVAMRVTRDAARAEEVVQDAFLHIWLSAHRFDPTRGSGISWILLVVRGRAMSRVRADMAREGRENDVHRREQPLRADTGDHTYETVAAWADVDRLRTELARLPEAQRLVLEHSFLRGRTYAEIAALTEVPVGTVKTRARGGLARLRRQLGVTEGPPGAPAHGAAQAAAALRRTS